MVLKTIFFSCDRSTLLTSCFHKLMNYCSYMFLVMLLQVLIICKYYFFCVKSLSCLIIFGRKYSVLKIMCYYKRTKLNKQFFIIPMNNRRFKIMQ